jgi:hypothetical protein
MQALGRAPNKEYHMSAAFRPVNGRNNTERESGEDESQEGGGMRVKSGG